MPDRRPPDEEDNGGTITADNYFTQLPDWLLDHPEVSDRALRIWLILMSHARSKQAKVAWLGRKKLAERCRCSIDSVDRAIKELREAGALSVIPRRREDDNAQTSNVYTLHTQPQPCGPPAAPVRPPRAAWVRRPPGHGCGAPRGMGAAPREKALDREHLSSLSRSLPGNDTGQPTALSPSWEPNRTHRMIADRIGLNLAEQVEAFRCTDAAARKRSNWDKTFSAFLKANDTETLAHWSTDRHGLRGA